MSASNELNALMEDIRGGIVGSRRRRLGFETCYSHQPMVSWIQGCIGADWFVDFPREYEHSPANWPFEEVEGLRQSAENWLKRRGVERAGWELDGHCESMAMINSRVAVDLIKNKTREEIRNADVANKAQIATSEKLRSLSPDDSAEHVFGPNVKDGNMDKGVPGWFARMDDLLHKQVSEVDVKCRSEYSSAFLYGSASAGEILKRVAEDSISLSTSTLTSTASAGAGYEAEKENKAAAGAAKEESQDTAPDTRTHACICTEPRIVPLYVMNYIFDGDELNDEQMLDTRYETAQYSIHVLALLMCPITKVAIICDSNGSLLPGGNIEHITMPLKKRRGKPTTMISNYDLDVLAEQKAEAAKAKGKGKGKKRKR